MFAALFALLALLLAAPHAAAPAPMAHHAPASTTAAEVPPAAPSSYFPQTWTTPIPFPVPDLPAGDDDTERMCLDPVDCPPSS